MPQTESIQSQQALTTLENLAKKLLGEGGLLNNIHLMAIAGIANNSDSNIKNEYVKIVGCVTLITKLYQAEAPLASMIAHFWNELIPPLAAVLDFTKNTVTGDPAILKLLEGHAFMQAEATARESEGLVNDVTEAQQTATLYRAAAAFVYLKLSGDFYDPSRHLECEFLEMLINVADKSAKSFVAENVELPTLSPEDRDRLFSPEGSDGVFTMEPERAHSPAPREIDNNGSNGSLHNPYLRH
jgi:hypothetical protein